jgi:ATP-dependent Clp protease ATP-binding subunit ClpC
MTEEWAMPANKMERFTARARRVLSLAHEEAENLHHSYIDTEHLLLGLLREEGGVAGRVLRDLGLDLDQTRKLVEELTKDDSRRPHVSLDVSPATKRVLELSISEARRIAQAQNHEQWFIGTESLLLALARYSDGVAMQVLDRFGVKGEDVRRQTRRVLQESPVQGQPPPTNIEIPPKPPARISMKKNRMLRVTLVDTLTETTKFEVKLTPQQVQQILDIMYLILEREDGSGIVLDDKDRSQRIEVFLEDDPPPTIASSTEAE